MMETKVLFNNVEISYAEDVTEKGSLKPSHIIAVENFNRKSRKNLSEAVVEEINIENQFLKEKYPKSKLIRFFQFKKGSVRTPNDLNLLRQAEKYTDENLLYESCCKQTFKSFKNQVYGVSSTANYSVVFEAESKELAKKIALCLNKGVKKFIIIAGKYGAVGFWKNKIIDPIQAEGGKVTALLLKRMQPQTRESYIKKMVDFGVDYVVHGKLKGWGDENTKPETLFLDVNDMIYKPIGEINDKGIHEALKYLVQSKHYAMSRLLTIKHAKIFAQAQKVKPIVEK